MKSKLQPMEGDKTEKILITCLKVFNVLAFILAVFYILSAFYFAYTYFRDVVFA